jgi:hypothetical protein
MKFTGLIAIVVALVVGIVPQFTDCQSQGRAITLANGTTIPMKCHWSAQAELVAAVPIGLVGILMVSSKKKESGRILAVLGIALGILAILIPTMLIGVCAAMGMSCNMIMRPVLILSGVLVIVASLAHLTISERQPTTA